MNNSKLFSDEAANIYERAIGTLLKKNMLLYFSFADYEEVSIPKMIAHEHETNGSPGFKRRADSSVSILSS